MARKDNPVAAPPNSTSLRTSIREFLNSSLSFEQLKQWAANLLTAKDLAQNLQGMPTDDQTKFVDKLDQVCRIFRLC